jgi:NAD(P)-dependent dehydrogenase (short-subunit alcohol dehydrogenase family)
MLKSHEEQLQPALQQVEQTLGPVSVLVNNAGIATFGKGVLEHSRQDWDRVIETNLNACFLLSKLAATSVSHMSEVARWHIWVAGSKRVDNPAVVGGPEARPR